MCQDHRIDKHKQSTQIFRITSLVNVQRGFFLSCFYMLNTSGVVVDTFNKHLEDRNALVKSIIHECEESLCVLHTQSDKQTQFHM